MTETLPPTSRQAEVLAAIRDLTVRGVPPTLRALAVRLGLSGPSRVHMLLRSMRDRGLVEWVPGRPRSLRIVGDPWSMLDTMDDAELRALRIRIDVVLADRARYAA